MQEFIRAAVEIYHDPLIPPLIGVIAMIVMWLAGFPPKGYIRLLLALLSILVLIYALYLAWTRALETVIGWAPLTIIGTTVLLWFSRGHIRDEIEEGEDRG